MQVSGKLSNIDAQGKYFSVSGNDFSMTNVRADITPEQKAQVMEFTDGQNVAFTGTVTNVGEVAGYAVKVEKIG